MATYNTLMLHDIVSVHAQERWQNPETGMHSISLVVTDRQRNQVTITLFSKEPLTIQKEPDQ